MNERAFTLHTVQFNSSEPKPDFINERCFGEDFAVWLREKLSSPGVEISEPIQEDWGWCLIASMGVAKFTISIGIMDKSIGQAPAEWRVGVAYERPMNGLRGLLKPVPRGELEILAARLQSILSSAANTGLVLPT
jgi:hypothetical protein